MFVEHYGLMLLFALAEIVVGESISSPFVMYVFEPRTTSMLDVGECFRMVPPF